MGLICKIKGHNYDQWGDWEGTEEIRVQAIEKFQENPKRCVPVKYQYEAKETRKRECNRCGRIDSETKQYEDKTLDRQRFEYIDADEVHASKELRELVDEKSFPTEVIFPPKDIHKSIKAHKKAKDRNAPVEIGDYITAGIEDFSNHYTGETDPVIKYEGFVIFAKKSPDDLDLGDKITVKITSFNEGDSATSIFVRTEEE